MPDYTFLEQFLHYMALDKSSIAEASFNMEWELFGNKARVDKDGKHVFVSGLARAGTTILMRSIYDTGCFCSLTYRDMPFVLAPNLWSKITNLSFRRMTAEQRVHSDGILIDFDSPEALDEVFWRVFTGDEYIQDTYLSPVEINENVINTFRRYIAIILAKYNGDRYLSKNNNNVLRIHNIRKAFPRAKILVPFRDPEAQARSLYQQHTLFSSMHKEDPFSKKYMTWLVHHEFGGDHRPIHFEKDSVAMDDNKEIDYWLNQWIRVYSFLLEHYESEENLIFIGYESLCNDTETVWPFLMNQIDLSCEKTPEFKMTKLNSNVIQNVSMLKKAKKIYERLNVLSQQQMT